MKNKKYFRAVLYGGGGVIAFVLVLLIAAWMTPCKVLGYGSLEQISQGKMTVKVNQKEFRLTRFDYLGGNQKMPEVGEVVCIVYLGLQCRICRGKIHERNLHWFVFRQQVNYFMTFGFLIMAMAAIIYFKMRYGCGHFIECPVIKKIKQQNLLSIG